MKYLIYASYEVGGREHFVDWLISAPYPSAAMNRAMERIGRMGGIKRCIDQVIEMTAGFLAWEVKANIHGVTKRGNR